MSLSSWVTRSASSLAWRVLVGERGLDTGQPRYIGGPSCDEALGDLVALLGTYVRPQSARVISNLDRTGHGDHALLIDTEDGAFVVRGGLASGYNGEGARALASAVRLLVDRECFPSDAVVRRDILLRARHCALTPNDLYEIRSGGDVRMGRHFTYYLDAPYFREATTWAYGRPTLPLSLLHPSLRRVAQAFFENPDQVLRDVARDLEERVRSQLPPGEDGKRKRDNIWEAAFLTPRSPLVWPDLDRAETLARVSLFNGAFGTIRNPRAHRSDVSDEYAFEELLLLSMLSGYLDEAEPRYALKRPSPV